MNNNFYVNARVCFPTGVVVQTEVLRRCRPEDWLGRPNMPEFYNDCVLLKSSNPITMMLDVPPGDVKATAGALRSLADALESGMR